MATDTQLPAKTVRDGESNLPEVPAHNLIQQAIEAGALQSETGIEVLERLTKLMERERAHQEKRAFNQSMAECQSDMRHVSPDGYNKQTDSKYATYDKLDKALRPIYTKHGFGLSFDTADCDRDQTVRVVCHVTHTDGHCHDYHIDMPADGKGAKGGAVMTTTHATGAAATYGMRYLLKMIFNVAIGEDDSDGNLGDPPTVITSIELDNLIQLIEDAGAEKAKICEWAEVGDLRDMSQDKYAKVVQSLTKRINKNGGQ